MEGTQSGRLEKRQGTVSAMGRVENRRVRCTWDGKGSDGLLEKEATQKKP